MPVGVTHLHLRGEAGVYPAGAGCTVACWQDFTLKNLGINATLRLSVLLYILQGFSKQRVISHGAGQVTEYSCTEALGAMAS